MALILKRLVLGLSLLVLISGCEEKQEIKLERLLVEKIPKLTSVGSALSNVKIREKDRNSDFFYTVSDGANKPSLMTIKIKKNLAQVVDIIPIDTDLKLDLEDVAVESPTKVWLSNEVGPSLIEFNVETKTIERILAPGQGLPSVLKYYQIGKGFEGLTFSGDSLFAALQAPLTVRTKDQRKPIFIRIFKVDPRSGEVKTYAYPIDRGIKDDAIGSEIPDVELSALAPLNSSRFLALEVRRIKGDKLLSVHIVICDISSATDISNLRAGNDELESETDSRPLFGSSISSKSGLIVPIKLTELVNLTKLGWTLNAPEGLAVYRDFKVLAVTNDSNEGMPELWNLELSEPIIEPLWQKVLPFLGSNFFIIIFLWALRSPPRENRIKVYKFSETKDLVINFEREEDDEPINNAPDKDAEIPKPKQETE